MKGALRIAKQGAFGEVIIPQVGNIHVVLDFAWELNKNCTARVATLELFQVLLTLNPYVGFRDHDLHVQGFGSSSNQELATNWFSFRWVRSARGDGLDPWHLSSDFWAMEGLWAIAANLCRDTLCGLGARRKR